MKKGKSFARSRMQEMKRREISKLNRSPRSSETSSLIQSEQFPSNPAQIQTSHSDVRIFSSRRILTAGVKQSGYRTENGFAEEYSRYSFRNQGCNSTINSYTSYLTQNSYGHHEGNVLKRRSGLTQQVESWILGNSMSGSNLRVPRGGHSYLLQGPKNYDRHNSQFNSFLIPNTYMKNTPPPSHSDSSFLPIGKFFRPIVGRNPRVDPQISRYQSEALPPRGSFHPAPNVASRHFPSQFRFPDPALTNKNVINVPPQAQSNLHDSSLPSDASGRIGDRIHPNISRNSSEKSWKVASEKAPPKAPGKNFNPALNVVSDHLRNQRSTSIPNILPPTDRRDSSLLSDGDAFEKIGDRIPPEDPQISAKSKNESAVTNPLIQNFSFPNSNLIPNINLENIAPTGRDSPLIPLDGTELSEEEEKKFRDTRMLTENFEKLHEEKLNKPMNSSGREESSVQSSITQIFSWLDLFLQEVQSESPESKLEVPSESSQEVQPESQQEESLESKLDVPSDSEQKESPESKLEVSSESSQEVQPESQQEESLESKLEVPLEPQQKESPEESKLEVPPESQLKVSLQPHSESPAIEVSCQHGYKLTFTVPHFPLDTNSFEKRTTPELESDYLLDFETTNLMDSVNCARSD